MGFLPLWTGIDPTYNPDVQPEIRCNRPSDVVTFPTTWPTRWYRLATPFRVKTKSDHSVFGCGLARRALIAADFRKHLRQVGNAKRNV